MSRGLEIDFETADRIALLVMQDQLKYLKQEVNDHVHKGMYMHPEDYHKSMTELIPSLETIIRYFGGSVE